MADRQLRPSRFSAGHTVGHPAARPPGNATVRYTPAPVVLPPPPQLTPAGPVESTNKLALASFILAVALGPVGALAAIPMALAANKHCATSGQRGAGLAKASVFIGLAYLVLAAAVLMLRLLLG